MLTELLDDLMDCTAARVEHGLSESGGFTIKRHGELKLAEATAKAKLEAHVAELEVRSRRLDTLCSPDYRTRVEELEAKVAELEAERDLAREMLVALKHTVVATIGGKDLEGNPTSEINYLQRLRILVETERKYKARA